MKIHLFLQKVLETLRHEGIWGLSRKIKFHLSKTNAIDDFDFIHGTDTCKIEPLWSLTIDSGNAKFGERYQASDEKAFTAFIKYLDLPTERFGFIDMGCGKGKALMLANSSGFASIIGVEFAEELVEVANKNIEIYGASRAKVIHRDVETFTFPEGPLVIYNYNSFKLKVFNRVLNNILSRREHPTYLVVVGAPFEIREALFSNNAFNYIGCVPEHEYVHIWKVGVQSRHLVDRSEDESFRL